MLKKNIIIRMIFIAFTSGLQGQASFLFDPGHLNSSNDGGNHGFEGICPCNVWEKYTTWQVTYPAYTIYSESEKYITRTDTTPQTLNARIAMANNGNGDEQDAFGYNIPSGGVDRFYSVHTNSWSDCTTRGTQIYIFGNFRNESKRERARAFASTNILSYMREARGYNDWTTYHGEAIIPKNSIAVLRSTNMPAILIELDFASYSPACSGFNDPEFFDVASEGIAISASCVSKNIEKVVPYIIKHWTKDNAEDQEATSIVVGTGESILFPNNKNESPSMWSHGRQTGETVKQYYVHDITLENDGWLFIEPYVHLYLSNSANIWWGNNQNLRDTNAASDHVLSYQDYLDGEVPTPILLGEGAEIIFEAPGQPCTTDYNEDGIYDCDGNCIDANVVQQVWGEVMQHLFCKIGQ